MNVIKPVIITDTEFVSSTVAENDYAAWNSGTTYSLGQRAIYQHRIVESLQNSNLNNTPTLVSTDTWWLDVGPTNRWAMFDQQINTQTVAAGATMTIVLNPGIINTLALLELNGSQAQVTMTVSGIGTVYDVTKQFDATPIVDWYGYFFEPYDIATEVVFSNLPAYLTGQVTVVITASSGQAKCGSLIVGSSYALGDTQLGARAGITDYSVKSTNAFGAVTITKRKYAKRMGATLQVPNSSIRRVQTLLADLRSTPCVWIGVPEDTDTYGPLVVFGFYKDFQIEVQYLAHSLCSLEIEGMI